MIELDTNLFLKINALAGKSELWDRVFIFASDNSLVIFGIILALFFFGRRKIFWTGLLSVGLARGIFTELIRHFFPRERPFVALEGVNRLVEKNGIEPSFPSGHATVLFAIAFSVYLYNKKLGAILVLGAFFLSFARVYAGVHYPGDIIGGIIVAAVAVWVVKSFRKRSSI